MRKIPVILTLLFGVIFTAFNFILGQSPSQEAALIGKKLAVRVETFDNQEKTLIETLLKVADEFHLPMGIEKVENVTINRPIQVRLKNVTVAQILDACIRQATNYSWAIRDDVILISSHSLEARASNLFNFVIPRFKAANISLDYANHDLSLSLYYQKVKPESYVESYLGDARLDGKLVNLDVKNATIRYILNRLVAQHGGSVWIARIAPEATDKLPSTSTIWQILPHGDYRPYFDPQSLQRSPEK
jgi:hypothetical protein